MWRGLVQIYMYTDVKYVYSLKARQVYSHRQGKGPAGATKGIPGGPSTQLASSFPLRNMQTSIKARNGTYCRGCVSAPSSACPWLAPLVVCLFTLCGVGADAWLDLAMGSVSIWRTHLL